MKFSEFLEFHRIFHVVSLFICELAGHGVRLKWLSIWNRVYQNLFFFLYLAMVLLLPNTPPPPRHQYTHPHSHGWTPSWATFAIHSLLESISCLSFDSLPLSELKTLITSNERRMAELKRLSLQLQQTCSSPCTDTVQVQPITGTGRKKD